MATTNYETNLRLGLSPIDPAFKGNPQQFSEELVRKLRILAPFGTGLFVEGSVEPTSNQGPWLKDGKAWYVWDNDSKSYVPGDISASLPTFYYVQDTEPPTDEEVYIWFQTSSNRIAGLYILLNGAWDPITLTSGTTAERPATPRPFQEFYDTDIEALIWYERGQWRTKDGVRGDVKQVTWDTGEEALLRNPGWEILGTGELSGTQYRARALGMASKDKAGTAPTTATVLNTGGLTEREAMTVGGGETAQTVLTEVQMPRHRHEFGMEDKALPVGSLAEDAAAIGDAGAQGLLAGDGDNYHRTDSGGTDAQKIALTRFRGLADPDPVVIPLTQASLFLFTLRKT